MGLLLRAREQALLFASAELMGTDVWLAVDWIHVAESGFFIVGN
jgi:hypothetical protein